MTSPRRQWLLAAVFALLFGSLYVVSARSFKSVSTASFQEWSQQTRVRLRKVESLLVKKVPLGEMQAALPQPVVISLELVHPDMQGTWQVRTPRFSELNRLDSAQLDEARSKVAEVSRLLIAIETSSFVTEGNRWRAGAMGLRLTVRDSEQRLKREFQLSDLTQVQEQVLLRLLMEFGEPGEGVASWYALKNVTSS